MNTDKEEQQLLDEPLAPISISILPWFFSTLLLGGLGVIIGVIAVFARPYSYSNGVHYEAISSIVIIAVFSLVWIFYRRHKPSNKKYAYIAEIVAIWVGFALGWITIDVTHFDGVLGIAGFGAFVCLIVAVNLLTSSNK